MISRARLRPVISDGMGLVKLPPLGGLPKLTDTPSFSLNEHVQLPRVNPPRGVLAPLDLTRSQQEYPIVNTDTDATLVTKSEKRKSKKKRRSQAYYSESTNVNCMESVEPVQIRQSLAGAASISPSPMQSTPLRFHSDSFENAGQSTTASLSSYTPITSTDTCNDTFNISDKPCKTNNSNGCTNLAIPTTFKEYHRLRVQELTAAHGGRIVNPAELTRRIHDEWKSMQS